MELIGTSVLINENTEYCSFVDFSGHVNVVNIRIFPNKVDVQNKFKLYSADLYYKADWLTEDEILNPIKDAKNVLSGYLHQLDGLEQSESTRP